MLFSLDPVHVGVDNLGVVRHDGDFLVLIRRMLDLRGRDTVRITKVSRSC